MWEKLHEDKDKQVKRFPVQHGWIYEVVEFGDMGGILKQHMLFAPAKTRVEYNYKDPNGRSHNDKSGRGYVETYLNVAGENYAIVVNEDEGSVVDIPLHSLILLYQDDD
jgi:hypothetical protein